MNLTLRGAIDVLRGAARHLVVGSTPVDIQAIILINERRFALLKEYRSQ